MKTHPLRQPRATARFAAALLAGLLAAPFASAQVAPVATYVTHMDALAAARTVAAPYQEYQFTNPNNTTVKVRIGQPTAATTANTITISPNASGDNYTKLVNAVTNARNLTNNGTVPVKLVLNPGTYRFDTVNSAAGIAAAVVFDNLDNVTIDATGAVFMINAPFSAIQITNSSRLRINGLTIDYGIVNNAKGQVLQDSYNGGQPYLRVFKPTPLTSNYPIDNTVPIIGIHAFTFGATVDGNRWLGGSYRNRTGNMTLQQLLRTNANSWDYDISTNLANLATPNSAERVLVEYWGKNTNNPATAATAIRIEGSGNSDVTLNGVTVHSSPYMGLIVTMAQSAGLWINGCNFIPNSTGVNPNVSSNIDSMNIEAVSDLAVTGTTTQLGGDDGLNFHQDGAAVVSRTGTTLNLDGAPPGGNGTVHLFDADFGYLGRCAYSAGANGKQIILTSPPAGYTATKWVGAGYLTTGNGRMFMSRVYVHNCTFKDALARGVLPMGAPNAYIDGCNIVRTQQAGIMLRGEAVGSHLGANALCTIDNNTLTSTNSGYAGADLLVPGEEQFYAAITCAVENAAMDAPTYPVNAKLKVTNNDINTTPKAGIAFVSTDGAIATGNNFSGVATDPATINGHTNKLKHDIVRQYSTAYSASNQPATVIP